MDQEYTRRLAKIEAVLSVLLPENPDATWVDRYVPGLPLPVSPALTKSLTLPGWDLVSRGGKRWRPLLATLICEGLGGGDAALALVPLVELPHNASLIHDDIEDNSDERRGRAAVHILYGTDTAINAGIDSVMWSRMDDTAHQPDEYALLDNILGDAKAMALLRMRE
jgi:octaprenyl-diphosphate synthase